MVQPFYSAHGVHQTGSCVLCKEGELSTADCMYGLCICKAKQNGVSNDVPANVFQISTCRALLE